MDNLRGAGLMTASMLFFALEDMFIKLASDRIPQGQIILVIACVGTSVFWTAARVKGQAILTPDLVSPVLLVRNGGEAVGTVGFILAITLAPLSVASAILMATPLVVTLAAPAFLGESVGWRRWCAVAIGLLGVLFVVQPGLEGFRPESLFAVLAVIALSARDVATRRTRAGLSSIQLSTSAFATLIPVGLAMMLVDGVPAVMPGAGAAATLAAGCVCGCFAYWLIVGAMRLGEVSFVTPFRYSRILFALVIGIAIFAERPNRLALLGIAVIVTSGLYTLWRERTLAMRARAH